MEKVLRGVNTFALLGILVVLILILVRLPHFPTSKDFRETKGDKAVFSKLQQEMPLVRVEEVRGIVSVDVTNSVEVTNAPYAELDVNVKNPELDVSIVR